MALDLSHLELRYINSCKTQGVLPSYAILSSFSNVKRHNLRILDIFLDQLASSDIPPLVDTLSSVGLSDIDAVDVCQRSHSSLLNGDCVLSLLHAINLKLRVVDLIDWSLWKNILQDICNRGLTCQILNMRFSPIQELEMTGKFLQLHTLNLDSSIHLSSFKVNCFSCMPKLTQLSLCATRVSNLWTTVAALSKLPSLVELRFQSCLCCCGTGPCPNYGGNSIRLYQKRLFGQQHQYTDARKLSFVNENFLLERLQYITGETPSDLYSSDDSYASHELLQTAAEGSSDDGDRDFPSIRPSVADQGEPSDDAIFEFNEAANLHSFQYNILATGNCSLNASYQLIEEIAYSGRGISAFEIDELESLSNNILDSHAFLDEYRSQFVFPNYYSASKLTNKNQTRDLGASEFTFEKSNLHNPSPICFEKYYREYMITSLAGLKVLDNLPVKDAERKKANETIKNYYEYTPYNRQPKESVVSILKEREVGSSGVSKWCPHKKNSYYRESCHSFTRSLAAAKLCSSSWPHFCPVSNISSPMEGIETFRPRQFGYHPSNPGLMVFGTLNGELVAVSHENQKLVGYLASIGALHSILGLCWLKTDPSKALGAVYDSSKDLHQEHINVVKFSHHSPMTFATASFDRDVKMWDLRQGTSQPCYTSSSSRGNAMVCFSPDDHYLLASAIDNEVKQFLAADGRLHMEFDIAPVRSTQNYTRSYYMNGSDYIISGSCEENVVCICCAQTGRRLKDISFELFHMSVLAAYLHPCTRSEIIQVNLLAPEDDIEESNTQPWHASSGMGG